MNVSEFIKENISLEVVTKDHGIEILGYKALCPFLDEKTPPFHNYCTHNYCFGSGKVGDAIDVESHFTGLSPVEAALSLAKRYGIRLPEFTPRDKERTDKLNAENPSHGEGFASSPRSRRPGLKR